MLENKSSQQQSRLNDELNQDDEEELGELNQVEYRLSEITTPRRRLDELTRIVEEVLRDEDVQRWTFNIIPFAENFELAIEFRRRWHGLDVKQPFCCSEVQHETYRKEISTIMLCPADQFLVIK